MALPRSHVLNKSGELSPSGIRKSWYDKFLSCILELVKQEAEAPVSPVWIDVADCEESRASSIPLVKQLLERLTDQSEQLSLQEERLALQAELIQQLKDEIARLKGEQGRPQIKPSTLEKQSGPRDNAGDNESDGETGGGKRPGSAKRKKTTETQPWIQYIWPPMWWLV